MVLTSAVRVNCGAQQTTHGTQNGVRARLRLGRVAANRQGTQTGGQLFLDTVYATSDRTEGKNIKIIDINHRLLSL